MRAIFGLLLVMLGLAMAVVWMPEHHGERQLAVVTDIATKGIARPGETAAMQEDRGGRTFSPHTPLLAAVEAPRGVQHTAAVARVVPAANQAVPPQTPSASSPPAATVVTAAIPNAATVVLPESAITPITRGVDPTAASRTSPAPTTNREELVRNLQRELKRVGCYWGDVDGDWGTGSRRAMSTFTERVNAQLPIDQPDFILLTLLRGHAGTACGKSCPTGQSMSENGRCIPNAVTAQARRNSERRTAALETPQVASAGTASAAWPATVSRDPVPAAPPQAPSLQAPAAAAAVAAATVAAATLPPLPGRMTVGGPQDVSVYGRQPDRSAARDAVRAEREQAAPAQASPTRSASNRTRDRRLTRRASSPAYRNPAYPVPYAGFYRPAPRYYAAAPSRRQTRGWTANFFGFNP